MRRKNCLLTYGTALLSLGIVCASSLLWNKAWKVESVRTELTFRGRPQQELLGVSGELLCECHDGRTLREPLVARLRELSREGQGPKVATRYEVEIEGGEMKLPSVSDLRSCAYGLTTRVLDERQVDMRERAVLVGSADSGDPMSRVELERLLADVHLNDKVAQALRGTLLGR